MRLYLGNSARWSIVTTDHYPLIGSDVLPIEKRQCQWPWAGSTCKVIHYCKPFRVIFTRATPSRVLAVVVCCLSVSVTRRYCIKMAKRRITQRTSRDRYLRDSSFLTPTFIGGRPPYPLKFALKVTHPLSNTTISTNIRSQRPNCESWRKSSISTNRKSTTRFSTSHRWTVYVILKFPKGWHKTRFWCFWPVKLTFVKRSLLQSLCKNV